MWVPGVEPDVTSVPTSTGMWAEGALSPSLSDPTGLVKTQALIMSTAQVPLPLL